jgi:two-component system NarL family sensor kinase
MSGEIESCRNSKRIIRRDGTTIWIQVDAGIVRGLSGRPVHAVAVIQDITKGKLAEESLLQAHHDLKELAARLIAAQEEERARIARELHDGTSQLVAALSLDVTNIRDSLPEGSIKASRGLNKLKQRIFHLAGNVRELSHELHPAVLEHAGLVAALQSFCTEFRNREKIKVALKIGTVPRLKNPQAALSLYRIVQEGLQNIRKHSRVKEAEVELSSVKNRLLLHVRDKGAGFDAEAARSSGLGLTSIQERVRLLGGKLKITSAPGRGTELLIEVPNARLAVRKKRTSSTPQ